MAVPFPCICSAFHRRGICTEVSSSLPQIRRKSAPLKTTSAVFSCLRSDLQVAVSPQTEFIEKLLDCEDLSEEEAEKSLEFLLRDGGNQALISAFLVLLRAKGETFEELTVLAHSLNLVLLLGDTALNSLRFPWFRISYFILLTAFYVIFEWVVHACVSTWWPYPFLDLSTEYAPLWYLVVALLHLPCYSIFALVVEIKYRLLTRWFPESYRFLR